MTRGLALAALIFGASLPVAAHEGHDKKKEEVVEEIEEVEVIEEPSAAPSAGATAAAAPAPIEEESKLGALLGYFHSAATHMPIAWLLLLTLVDLATFVFGRRELMRLGMWLGVLALASFVPAVITGLERIEHLGMPPEELVAATFHRNVMFGCGGALAIAMVVRWRGKNALTGITGYIYLALVIVAAAMVVRGGHLGGALVYGEPPF
jgi:uncharacterized membrane protein